MEYPLAHDFYHRSNTHDPDQDRFEDLYRHDFIHTISWVAHHKLARCECASCYAPANRPRTVPKFCLSWLVANRKGSIRLSQWLVLT